VAVVYVNQIIGKVPMMIPTDEIEEILQSSQQPDLSLVRMRGGGFYVVAQSKAEIENQINNGSFEVRTEL